jgi:uroporphyrinogen III methyltransferase / synthase
MKRTVVVTRDEPADGPLSAHLRALGLQVLSWPVVRVAPVEDAAPLEAALSEAARLDWIVFTSRHAVEAVAARLGVRPEHLRIAAVGASTASALGEHGWTPNVVPEQPSAAGLLVALTPLIRPGARVLFPASSRVLPVLTAGLRRLGAEVLQIEAYRTDPAALDVDACRRCIEREAVAAVTFTSPSCVEELEHALGPEHFARLLASSSPIALGPTTGRALAQRGFEPVLAQPPTLEGLAATTYRNLNPRP